MAAVAALEKSSRRREIPLPFDVLRPENKEGDEELRRCLVGRSAGYCGYSASFHIAASTLDRLKLHVG